MQTIETFSVRFFMGSRKLLLRVCNFTLPGFPIYVRRSLFSTAMFFFRQVDVHHFYHPPKTGIIHLCELKNPTNTSQTDRNLLRVFEREAVQFLVAKILAVSHLPLKAPPAVQT